MSMSPTSTSPTIASVQKPRTRRAERSGFTLIELLVVIAIIAILAAILFPVFAQARERARAASCLSNMKQIGIAMGMYTQDYDEFLPETGLGGVFRNATNTGLGQNFAGVLPFNLAVQPYTKNYQVFACSSDDKQMNTSIDRSGMRDMMIAANVPGAQSLPAYSNTPAFHQAVAKIAPNSYATNYILSQTYGYTGRNGAVVYSTDDASKGGTFQGRGRSLVAIQEPTNVYILSEWSAGSSTGSAGWYFIAGYLNDNTGGLKERWRNGRRHFEGRQWLFVDGHAKWYKDPPFERSPGVATSGTDIRNYYNAKQVYTTPN